MAYQLPGRLRGEGFTCQLDGSEAVDRFYLPLWNRSTHFGLVLHVDARIVLGETGQKKIGRVRKELHSAGVPPGTESTYWVSQWPGTRSYSDNQILAVGRTGAALFELMFVGIANPYWGKNGGWEDLFLFRGRAITTYVCSHEYFGSAYGDEAMLRSVGREPSRMSQPEEFPLTADAIDSPTWDLLVGGAPR